jgi:hypothetical protein
MIAVENNDRMPVAKKLLHFGHFQNIVYPIATNKSGGAMKLRFERTCSGISISKNACNKDMASNSRRLTAETRRAILYRNQSFLFEIKGCENSFRRT